MTLTRRDLLAGAAAGAGLTGTPDWLHAAPASAGTAAGPRPKVLRSAFPASETGFDPVQRLIEQHGIDPGLGPEGEQALGDAVEGGGRGHSYS